MHMLVVFLVMFFVGMSSATSVASEEFSLQFRGVFQHSHPATPYIGTLSGVISLELAEEPTGSALAVMRLERKAGSCFATASWVLSNPPDPRGTHAVELCLVEAGAGEEVLNAFLDGQSKINPSLMIPLQPQGSIPGHWVSASQLSAQLFLRGCVAGSYVKYADLVFAPGALEFTSFVDAQGQMQIELLPASGTLANLLPTTWSAILSACKGTERGLPQTPSPGATSDFSATSVLPPGVPGLHQELESLAQAANALVGSNSLTARKAKSLTRRIDKAGSNLKQARPEKAARKVNSFVRKTAALIEKGVLSPSQGQPLVDQGTALRDGILADAFSGPSPIPPVFCPDPPLCPVTVYHVRASRGIILAPDGSPERPFRTIADALARAADPDDAACAVEVRVQRGAYFEDLTITRPTRIIGDNRRRVLIPATVSNSGGHLLEISSLTFDGSGPLGAVVVDHPCAITELRDVSIGDARRFGIFQRGGTLEADEVSVATTQADAGAIELGTAIYLTGGVEATLTTLHLVSNQSAALVAEGSGTRVWASHLIVEENTVNHFFRAQIVNGEVAEGIATVEIRDGAFLQLQHSLIQTGQVFGLYVDRGAEAHFLHGTVARTRALESDGHTAGGTNIMVSRGASLEITNFQIDRGRLAGLHIVDAGADASEGLVSRNSVGVCIRDDDFEVRRVRNRVLYIGNERTFDGGSLPVPQVLDGLP